jgi:hypothetical protein
LQLAQAALEKLYLEKELSFKEEALGAEKVELLEKQLTAKFLDLKSKIQYKGNPYWKAFIVSLICSSVIGISLIITAGIITLQLDSLISSPVDKALGVVQESLKSELPKITSEVVKEIPQISNAVRENIPRAVDNLTNILDEKFESILSSEINAAVEKKLPEILEQKLKSTGGKVQ